MLADQQDMGRSWRIYIKIARPDHWVKHVFIIPGIVAAIALLAPLEEHILYRILLGTISACLISSGNYVINEWLDAEFDRHHPLKQFRPGAQGNLSGRIVTVEYLILAAVGLALASQLGPLFQYASLLFVLSGITYNVRPFRTKDCAFLDVMSEAINNPIRLALGWAMVSSMTLPPLSLIGSYWMGGAFLMAAKRLGEYRFITQEKGEAAARLYRKSFATYNVELLIVSCFMYAVIANFLLAVFLIKYRTEYLLSFPLFAILFAYYLHLALKPASIAQRPERLHRDRGLIVILVFLTATLTLLSFIDIPLLEQAASSHFLQLRLSQ
ncbi:MAG: UbiA prenyltransferase family protein [Rhodospirillum sp.]|nr:UbiA prenyltransferase family protein [Rhodospirillum sp.]MCF8489096.1 UbiA prenyltransferase family protein [Rhodospirillum sp.]MCF8498886.1 UbiA prenyltransferase family protein [Rhodospirillum sp.]